MRVYPNSPIRFVLAGLALAVTPALPAGPDVRLTYSPARDRVTVNEPVYLKVLAESSLGHDITIDLELVFCNRLHATLARPDGRVDVVPREHIVVYQMCLAGPANERVLAAHGRRETTLLLNRWFSFDVPGRYFLDLELFGSPGPPEQDPGLEVESKGAVIIDVGVRDASRLTDLCASLEREIIAAPSSNPPWDKIERLGLVVDPVAVPYLAGLLEQREALYHQLVPALARIGNDAAVDALIGQLGRIPEYGKAEVRVALAGIGNRTTDPRIKERVAVALK